MAVAICGRSAGAVRAVAFALTVVVACGLLFARPAAAEDTTSPAFFGWGDNGEEQASAPAALTAVPIALAAGDAHSLAVLPSGAVVAWGLDSAGQATVPVDLSGVAAVAAGAAFSLALKTDGTVVAWGDDTFGQSPVPDGVTDVVAISAGFAHGLALKSDGTVIAWGDDTYGQAAVPDGLANVTAIAAGAFHSLALKSDGTVVGWGDDSFGAPPGGLASVTAIAAGSGHRLALKSDGTVVAWGDDSDGQATVPAGLQHVTKIAAGQLHSVAVTRGGRVVAWGVDGDAVTDVPTGLARVTLLAAGGGHNLTVGEIDTTPPAAVTGVVLTAGSGMAKVDWANPADADLARVDVRVKAGGAPASISDGQPLCFAATPAATCSGGGLAAGTKYGVAVFAVDTAENAATGVAVTLYGSKLSLVASPKALIFGATTKLTATLRRGDDNSTLPDLTVTIQRQLQQAGGTWGAWSNIASGATASAGTLVKNDAAPRNARYRALFIGGGMVLGATPSALQAVTVAPKITAVLSAATVGRGAKATLTGAVAPTRAGRTVQLQRKTSTGTWQGVASTKLSAASRYTFPLPTSTAGTRTYRVILPALAPYSKGISPPRSLKVT